jgi:hypothetical protein
MDVTYGVPVDELVTAIKRAIKQANVSSTDADRDLQVAMVYLKLHTIATIKAGGSLDFRIPVLGMKLKIGGSVTHQDTHSLEMTFVPEEPGPQHEVRDGEVETALVEAIETLRAVMARAAEGDDPFVLRDSSVELTFAVSEDGTVSFGVDGDLRDEVTHTMRLSLQRPQQGRYH